MDQIATSVSAGDHAFELARWYHDFAKLCIQAAEQHVSLTEDSPLEDVDRAMRTNELVRIRMGTMQSVERMFRSEFQRLYIDYQVERLLTASEIV
jgi:hypothetical protein